MHVIRSGQKQELVDITTETD